MYVAILYGYALSPEHKAELGERDWDAMNAEADAMLEQRIASATEEHTILDSTDMRAGLKAATGHPAEAVAIWTATLEAAPSCTRTTRMLGWSDDYDVAFDDPAGFCAAHRGPCDEEGNLLYYMSLCYNLNPADSLAAALPWATAEEIARYEASAAQAQAEQDAYWAEKDAEREAEAAASQPSSSSSSSSSTASSGGSPQLKNNCSQTVKLFYGDKPKFGSGRYSSIGSNTSTSSGLRPGDMLWIVDDAQNGISSVTVSAGMQRIEITQSCTGFTTN
jgi:hypothetical protein